MRSSDRPMDCRCSNPSFHALPPNTEGSMNRLVPVLCLAFVAATPALAQDARVIDPGMTREQVVAELGAPVQTRSAGRFVYLFYANGCERTCGMQDLVVLENDAVVDAIFRSARRSYS